MLKELNELNRPKVNIFRADSPDLFPYGRIIEGIDFSDMYTYSITTSEPDKTVYIRDLKILQDCRSFSKVQKQIYGKSTTLQTGLCFGMNDKMNGMEFHKGSEVIVAVTDLVLILGRNTDITDNSWDSSMAKCFFLAKGTAVELYGGTLHLAPCRVTAQPFCSIIILPEGTNLHLDEDNKGGDILLFMKNKWLICHKDSPAADRGAFVGITGDNIQIHV